MHNRKTLFAVLAAVSICLAQSINISGRVTNTSGAAIAGALVELENEALTATTGADGLFSLTRGTPIISGGNNQSLPHLLEATIHNGLLSINVLEKTDVTITTFSLHGKALSTVRQLFDAGIHSLALPQNGVGVYFCKVTSSGREIVLKGYSAGGISPETAISVQGSSSSAVLAKQTMASVSQFRWYRGWICPCGTLDIRLLSQ